MGGWGHTADRVRRWGASRTAYPGSTRCLGARPLSPEARNDPLGLSLGAHTWAIHAGKVDTMALIRTCALGLQCLQLGAELPPLLLELQDFLRRGLRAGITQDPNFG
jgi:hypothetical protein